MSYFKNYVYFSSYQIRQTGLGTNIFAGTSQSTDTMKFAKIHIPIADYPYNMISIEFTYRYGYSSLSNGRTGKLLIYFLADTSRLYISYPSLYFINGNQALYTELDKTRAEIVARTSSEPTSIPYYVDLYIPTNPYGIFIMNNICGSDGARNVNFTHTVITGVLTIPDTATFQFNMFKCIDSGDIGNTVDYAYEKITESASTVDTIRSKLNSLATVFYSTIGYYRRAKAYIRSADSKIFKSTTIDGQFNLIYYNNSNNKIIMDQIILDNNGNSKYIRFVDGTYTDLSLEDTSLNFTYSLYA